MSIVSPKKLFTLSALFVGMFSVSAFAADPTPPKAVTVNGGTVHFTGSIVDAACAVDNGSDGETVKLGQFRAADLATAGKESGKVPFTIKLTDCDLGGDTKTAPYSRVAVTFSGDTASGNTKALAVKPATSAAADEAASNVGVEILQAGKALALDGSALATASNLSKGDNELKFNAAYIATADKATAGEANADVTFKLTYE